MLEESQSADAAKSRAVSSADYERVPKAVAIRSGATQRPTASGNLDRGVLEVPIAERVANTLRITTLREIAEFRIDERYASLLLDDHEGKRLGDSVRKFEIETTDPRFIKIGELQRDLRHRNGEPFFYGWEVRRQYSARELSAVTALRMRVLTAFEPAGEECGTRYDEFSACVRCGAGARQMGPLMLDTKRIPRSKDFARTIADEIVVSQRVADALNSKGISGAELRPVVSARRTIETSPRWYQFVPQQDDAVIVPPTRVASNPFDDDPRGDYRCSTGHLLGLNQLSELSIAAESWRGLDVVSTKQFIGIRRGVLRPWRPVLVSSKLWRLITDQGWKGCAFEVVHLVA